MNRKYKKTKTPLEGFIRPLVVKYFMIRLVSYCKWLRVAFQSVKLPEVVVHAQQMDHYQRLGGHDYSGQEGII
jgi:hypothetical protein